MKRILFLLVLYCSLFVATGKYVRSFYFQILAETSLTVKTFLLDLKQGEAEGSETEETDSEDSEENSSKNCDDHELTQSNFYRVAAVAQPKRHIEIAFLKDRPKEISTPPPRF